MNGNYTKEIQQISRWMLGFQTGNRLDRREGQMSHEFDGKINNLYYVSAIIK